MKKGQISPFMQTAQYFKTKYASEWQEVQAKFKQGNVVKFVDENKTTMDVAKI